MRTGIWGCAATALSVGLTAGGALGQIADGESGSAAEGVEVISVTATRNPIRTFDYAGQVTVIGRDVIEDFNPSSLTDIFDAIPGAQFDGGPRRSGETPSVRGLSGEGVLVLFDGARQSFLSGHDGRFFIDPTLVREVEVVRGPTSALYGSGALGGVIAVRTIEAQDLLLDGERFGMEIGGGFQSVNDEWRGSTTAGWRSADGIFDLVGNVTYRDSEDIRLGSRLDLPSDDEILSSLVKGTIAPREDFTVALSWIRFDGDSIDPNNPQGANIANPGNSQVFRDISGNTIQGVINYAPAENNLVDMNVVSYYTKNEVAEDEVDTDRLISREVETVGVAIDNRSRFRLADALDVNFTYGGEYYVDEQTGRDNTTADGTRGGVPDAKSRFYGLFLQAEMSVERPLGAPGVFSVVPGFRWDRFENEAPGEPSTEDSALSPKIGLTYKPIEQVILFGNWGEAFRAPSFNESFADGVHFQIPNLSVPGPFGPFGPPAFVTNFFISNPDLAPEDSETWEVGAGVDLDSILFDGDRFTGKASYYESDVTNLIDLEVNIPFTCFLTPDQILPFFPPCGSGEAFGNFSRNVNVTNAALSGVEMEASYDSEYFYARANYAGIDGIDKDAGDFVGVLAPNRFFIDGGVKTPRFDARLGARVTVAGKFNEVNDATQARDGYARGDIYFVWEPESAFGGAFDGLRLDLGVDNVTDADYEVVAAGVSEPGRNFKIALSWRRGF